MATIEVSPASDADDGVVIDDTTFNDSNPPILGQNTGSQVFDHWLRFPSVTIGQGDTIDVAYITFTRSAAQGSSVLSNIYGVDEDDHAAPTDTSEWSTDHGIHTTASVTWDFTPSGSGTVQTPSIVSIIQEIVDRASWASGNDIGIHVDDDGSSNGNAQQFNDFTDTEAVLHIEYTAGGTPGSASPGVISAALTIPAVSPAGSAVTSPAVTSAALTIPAPTLAGPAVAAPSEIAATLAIPAASALGGTVVEPAVIPLAATLPAASVAGPAVAAPSSIDLAALINQVTLAGGAVASPAVLSAALVIPQATPVSGDGTVVTPGVIALSAALNQATPAGGGVAAVSQIGLTLAIPAASVAGGGIASPAVLSAALLIPAASAAGPATAAPNATDIALVIPAASVAGSAVATPAEIAVALTIPQATVLTPSAGTASPDTIALSALVNAVTVAGSGVAAPATLGLVVVIYTPKVVLATTFKGFPSPPGDTPASTGSVLDRAGSSVRQRGSRQPKSSGGSRPW